MFVRPCRNTRTYEQLYCVSSNVHQSQHPLSANCSSRCQGSGTLSACILDWKTLPWILVFFVLLYIAWAAQVPNKSAGSRRYIIVAGGRWRSVAREVKWLSPNKRGILSVKEWVESSASVSVRHLSCKNSLFPLSWDFGFARIKNESGTSGIGPKEWV